MAYRGAIFDVDGVLVDSPHELAWRESFRALMETEWRDIRDQTSWTPERFSPAVYQRVMAGMPRMAGARAAMEHFGVPDIDARVEQYAAGKQEYVVRLIEEGAVDAIRPPAGFVGATVYVHGGETAEAQRRFPLAEPKIVLQVIGPHLHLQEERSVALQPL
jgi:hypothetical protein